MGSDQAGSEEVGMCSKGVKLLGREVASTAEIGFRADGLITMSTQVM